MAPYANKKKVSAPGVSFAGTGVNQGGNTARPKSLHGGLTSVKVGGANSAGTLKKFVPPKIAAPAALKPLKLSRSMKPVGSGGTHSQPVQNPTAVAHPVKPTVKPAVKPGVSGAASGANGLKVIKAPVYNPATDPNRPQVTAQDSATRMAQQKAQQAYDLRVKQNGTTAAGKPAGMAAPKPAPADGDVGGYAPIRPKMLFIANGKMYYSNGVGGYSYIPNPTKQQLNSASKKAPSGWDPTWLSARPRPAGTPPAGSGLPNTTSAPVAPKPVAPKVFSDLTTWDDPYKAAIAQAGYQYDLAGRPIAALDQELEANKQRWSAGLEGLFRSTNQNAYSDNASLAARGIFNSGERINQDENRTLGFTSSLGELNTSVGGAADPRLAARYANLGPGRASAIATQRNEINSDRDNQKKLAVQEAEAAALQRAIDEYVIKNAPATPVAGQSDGQGGTVKKKAIDRAKVGWFTKGKDVYFRNEWGDEAKVDPKKVSAAWKKNTKRAA